MDYESSDRSWDDALLDCRSHGRVEVLLADQIEDAGSFQVIAHVAVEAGEDERDGFLA